MKIEKIKEQLKIESDEKVKELLGLVLEDICLEDDKYGKEDED